MKIRQWNKGDGAYDSPGIMIMASKHEAICLIRSLAQQVEEDDCNNFRKEFFTDDGKQFSIAVVDEDILFLGEKILKNCDDDTEPKYDDNICSKCGDQYDYCECCDCCDRCGEIHDKQESCCAK